MEQRPYVYEGNAPPTWMQPPPMPGAMSGFRKAAQRAAKWTWVYLAFTFVMAALCAIVMYGGIISMTPVQWDRAVNDAVDDGQTVQMIQGWGQQTTAWFVAGLPLCGCGGPLLVVGLLSLGMGAGSKVAGGMNVAVLIVLTLVHGLVALMGMVGTMGGQGGAMGVIGGGCCAAVMFVVPLMLCVNAVVQVFRFMSTPKDA